MQRRAKVSASPPAECFAFFAVGPLPPISEQTSCTVAVWLRTSHRLPFCVAPWLDIMGKLMKVRNSLSGRMGWRRFALRVIGSGCGGNNISVTCINSLHSVLYPFTATVALTATVERTKYVGEACAKKRWIWEGEKE